MFFLGLGNSVVGITKFCVHPHDVVREITKVGGTKLHDLEAIAALRPDLIIANKEENDQRQIEQLARRFPVWVSDINDLQTANQMILQVGEMTGKPLEATDLVQRIRIDFAGLQQAAKTKRALYLIWRKPYMAAGADTFITDMLQYCGLKNVIDKMRYPELSASEIRGLMPDVVLLSSEPYPFRERHINEIRQLLPYAKAQLVDGEMFSWYGSRLLLAAEYFKSLRQSLVK